MLAAVDTDTLITWGAVFKQYKKGETIFHEEGIPLFYHKVETGTVKMINCSDLGREFIQGIFTAGESFGEPPLFFNGHYPASAVADTNTTILRLRKEVFFQLLKENPEIHFAFTKLLCQRLHHKAIISKELACFEPEHRILTVLEMFCNEQSQSGNTKIRIPYTRQQIADMTGLRVETIIRTMRAMEQKGMLQINGGKVYLDKHDLTHKK